MEGSFQHPKICDYSCQHYIVSRKKGDSCSMDNHRVYSGIMCRNYLEGQQAIDASDNVEFVDDSLDECRIEKRISLKSLEETPLGRALKIILLKKRFDNIDDTV